MSFWAEYKSVWYRGHGIEFICDLGICPDGSELQLFRRLISSWSLTPWKGNGVVRITNVAWDETKTAVVNKTINLNRKNDSLVHLAFSFSSRGIAHAPQSFGRSVVHQSLGKTKHVKLENYREIFQMKLSKSVLLASIGLSSQFSFGQISVSNSGFNKLYIKLNKGPSESVETQWSCHYL